MNNCSTPPHVVLSSTKIPSVSYQHSVVFSDVFHKTSVVFLQQQRVIQIHRNKWYIHWWHWRSPWQRIHPNWSSLIDILPTLQAKQPKKYALRNQKSIIFWSTNYRDKPIETMSYLSNIFPLQRKVLRLQSSVRSRSCESVKKPLDLCKHIRKGSGQGTQKWLYFHSVVCHPRNMAGKIFANSPPFLFPPIHDPGYSSANS